MTDKQLYAVTIRRTYTPLGLEIWPQRNGKDYTEQVVHDFAESRDALRKTWDEREARGMGDYWDEKFKDTAVLIEQVTLEQWQAMNDSAHRSASYWLDQLCCTKAIQVFCVCRYKTLCPDHGARCHGSHD